METKDGKNAFLRVAVLKNTALLQERLFIKKTKYCYDNAIELGEIIESFAFRTLSSNNITI